MPKRTPLIALVVLALASKTWAEPGISPDEGLISYWGFEGTTDDMAPLTLNNSGLDEDDLSAHGGAPQYVDGWVGQALAINPNPGGTVWLNAPTSDDVILGPEYTIEAWVHPTVLDEAWQRLVLRWQDQLGYHFALRLVGGNWTVSLFHTQSDGTIVNADGGNVPADEWSHIAGVADGSMLRVYLNGEQVAEAPYDGTINEAPGNGLGIADMAGGNGLRFNGYLDELAIWNIALTPEELASHADAAGEGYGLTFDCEEELDRVEIEAESDGLVDQGVNVGAVFYGADDPTMVSFTWTLVSGDATLSEENVGDEHADVQVTGHSVGAVIIRIEAEDHLCGNVVSAEHRIDFFGGEGTSPETGLVSYWSFDDTITDDAAMMLETASASVDDWSPLGGDPTYAAGRVGLALEVGTGAGVVTNLTARNSEDVELSPVYTIECWILPTDLSGDWQRILLRWGTNGASYHFGIRNNSGFVQGVSLFHGQSDGTQPNANGGTVVTDRWQHIAGVADGEMLRVYLDGEEVAATPYDGTITQGHGEPLGLADSGTAFSGIQYNGRIDELAIWNVALTPEEIASHFSAGPGGYGLTLGCQENRDSVSISGPTLGSVGQAVELTAEFLGVDPGATSNIDWELTGGDASLSTTRGPVTELTPNAAGPISVRVTAADDLCGNEVTAEHTVTVFPGDEGESPDAGLVSYWSFDEGTNDHSDDFDSDEGQSFDDLTPAQGEARFVEGLRGNALAIGVEPTDPPWLTAPDSADVSLPETYTIECWIYPTELAAPWQRLVLRWDSFGLAYHFGIKNNGGDVNAVSLFHAQADGATPNANGGTVALSRWQHIAGVADGEMLRVYLDGQEVAAVAYDGTINAAVGGGMGLGDSFEGNSGIQYNGLVDELAIWNVALTPDELLSHYEAGPAGYGIGGSCQEAPDSVEITGPSTAYLDEPAVELSAPFTGADDGAEVTWSWEIVSGFAKLTESSGETVGLLPLSGNEIVVRVTADDGVCPERGGATAELTICTERRDGVEIVGPSNALLEETVTLRAEFSGNDIQEDAEYTWELVRGVAGFADNDDGTVAVTCVDEGEIVISVKVADGGCEDEAAAEFTLNCVEGIVFSRGDPNGDGNMDLSDGVFILNFLFTGGDAPECTEAANSNDDTNVDLSDGVFILNHLFTGGPASASPGPPNVGSPCGRDPADSVSDLGCLSYTRCP